ncbi:MAG: hypothetical protein C5B50_27090 [Verrucomicrobia bacterium]|nr:MAG: hypothetical protein C5B50_27090 [Verrucomicrobiota bacterium]
MINTNTASNPARRNLLASFATAATLAFMLGAIARETPALGQTTLKAGDIVYADSGDAIVGGAIIKVDGVTGVKSVISSGGFLHMPFDVVLEGGTIVVSDSCRLIAIDPAKGTQTLLADNSAGTLGSPYGVTLSHSGSLLAANLAAIVQVNPSSGQVQQLYSGAFLGYPLGVAVASNGQIYVLSICSTGRQIININPSTGVSRIVTQGLYLKNPQAIAVQGNDIYVTDVATPDGNFGTGCIIHINAQTGAQSILSRGNNLAGPVGIAINSSGQLIVGDPYTSLTPDDYTGAIIRISTTDGSQTVLARGADSFVNPRGVAVVPGK